MFEVFVHKNQLYNFLILKEPIQLITDPVIPDYFRLYIPFKDIMINSYKTYSTVELLTFRKRLLRWLKRK